MLAEKLDQAHRAARRRRIMLSAGLSGGVVAVALFVLGVVEINLTPWKDTAQSPASETAPTTPPLSKVAPQPASPDARRTAFKQQLTAFEDDMLADIESAAFATWNSEAQQAILSDKDAAVAAFANADYDTALRDLKNATSLAEQQRTARDNAFETALLNAAISAATDDVDKAQLAINEALRLKPESAAARALSEKIAQLPKVLNLIERATVARTENDLPGEAALLREALELDPTRTPLKDRLKAVQAAIREDLFAGHINAGLSAAAARDLKSAQNSLLAAEAIFSDRDELKLLNEAVRKLALTLKVERLTAKAEAAAARDDWRQAQTLFREAVTLMPDPKSIRDGVALSNNIVAAADAVSDFLARPERLAAKNIADQAQSARQRAAQYAALSPSLKAAQAELSKLIEAYATPVDVTVISDNATRVSVRGVGQVGTVAEKVITLNPGSYTFEGARTGFRSVLVKLDIAPGQSGVSIKVVCHERI